MKNKLGLIGSLFLVGLLLLAGCSDDTSADGGKIFEIGTQDYTDPKIVAQIVKELVEDRTNHEMNVTEDIQASPQIINALDQGEFDLATLYSGEVYNNHFDDVTFTTDPDETLDQAKKFFGDEFDLKWYDSLGFNNQYSVAVPKEFAEENDIQTMTDLGAYADQMTLGTDSAWKERENDGYRAYQEAYGYSFSDVRAIEISLMYSGISNGELDAITAYTVDPQVAEENLHVLEDDKAFFPPYDASLVGRNDMIEEYPEIAEILDKLVDSISTEEMTEMIREVELDGKDSNEVAKDFLIEKGMLDK